MSTPCRAETTVGGKYRTCDREAGHGGRHRTTYCGGTHRWRDPEPSSTAKAIERIRDAMEILEAAGCGGVGAEGMTIDEMRAAWDRGQVPGNDAYYETCQHAWLALKGAMDALMEESNE